MSSTLTELRRMQQGWLLHSTLTGLRHQPNGWRFAYPGKAGNMIFNPKVGNGIKLRNNGNGFESSIFDFAEVRADCRVKNIIILMPLLQSWVAACLMGKATTPLHRMKRAGWSPTKPALTTLVQSTYPAPKIRLAL
jgi:hypothetical protein